MAASDNVDVTIRIDLSESDERFEEIVRLLAERGLRDAVPRPRFRIVNGSVPAEGMEALREVPGVRSVRADRTYRTS